MISTKVLRNTKKKAPNAVKGNSLAGKKICLESPYHRDLENKIPIKAQCHACIAYNKSIKCNVCFMVTLVLELPVSHG